MIIRSNNYLCLTNQQRYVDWSGIGIESFKQRSGKGDLIDSL